MSVTSAWSTLREAMRGSPIDYTTAPVGRAVVMLAVPMVMEMAMESIFAIVNVFWVAHLGAAAQRLPFLPMRAGLGSDVLVNNSWIKTVTSPYPGPDGVGEELVAMPALELDAALCHLDVADARGNAAFLGPDLYFDDLMLAAARTGGRFISTDRVVPTAQLAEIAGTELRLRVNRMMVDGVVERDGAAHFTAAEPRHPRDEAVQQAYFAAAKSPEAWEEFRAEYVDVDEDTYQATVRAQGEGGAR